MKADLYQKAADNPTLPMKEVYKQYMDSADTALDDDLLEPQLRSCRSQMYRARRHNMAHLPPTRDDILLEGQWAMTTDNQPFVIHQDKDMVLLELRDVCCCRHRLHGLDLQDIASSLYPAVYLAHCLHGVLHTSCLRTLERQVQQHLQPDVRSSPQRDGNIEPDLQPSFTHVDFKSAILHSLRQHFPKATIKGCNFHFNQAVWHKVQSLGIFSQ